MENKEEIQKRIKNDLMFISLYGHSLLSRDKALHCVRLAQSINDIELEFESRFDYLTELIFLDFYEEAILQFPWFLNLCDKNPGKFEYKNVLWAYKWILSCVPHSAKIPYQRIQELIKDFEQRFRDYGTGEKVIEYFKMKVCLTMGNVAEAREHYSAYASLNTKSILDDCYACQVSNCLNLHHFTQDYDGVIKNSVDILNGKLKCSEVPMTSYPKVLLASLFLADEERSDYLFSLANKKLNLAAPKLIDYYQLMVYCGLRGNWKEGKRIFEGQIAFAEKSKGDVDLFHFYLACSLYFSAMEKQGKKTASLKLPESMLTGFSQKQKIPVKELTTRFDELSGELSRKLDERNRNSFYTEHKKYFTGWFENKLAEVPNQ